jgi:hypothetical protein
LVKALLGEYQFHVLVNRADRADGAETADQ